MVSDFEVTQQLEEFFKTMAHDPGVSRAIDIGAAHPRTPLAYSGYVPRNALTMVTRCVTISFHDRVVREQGNRKDLESGVLEEASERYSGKGADEVAATQCRRRSEGSLDSCVEPNRNPERRSKGTAQH